jgi:Leucine-rich repeat (LRR) protein
MAIRILLSVLIICCRHIVILPCDIADFGLINFHDWIKYDLSSKCPETEHCTCVQNQYQTEYKLYCPTQIDSKIILRAHSRYPNTNIKIDCSSNDTFDYTLLPKLNIFDLKGVGFSACTLPSNVSLFSGLCDMNLQKVRELYIGRCNIKLNNQDFDGFTNLELLELVEYNTYDLSMDVFNSLTSLGTLVLNNVRLDLKFNMFARLEHLVFFAHINNDFKSIDQGIFNNLTKLESLNLNKNMIKNISKEVFYGLFSLKWLFLEDNLLDEIDKDVFKGLFNLRTISIKNNIIQKLSETLFIDQIQLIDLDLSENELVELPNNLFAVNAPLQKLQLSSNKLVNITR